MVVYHGLMTINLLIYRYDATLGTQITTNDILTMLKATTTVPGLRNNITGNRKNTSRSWRKT